MKKLLPAATGPAEDAGKEIVTAWQNSLDASSAVPPMRHCSAMQIDTGEWVSITVGRKARARQELEPFVCRDIASLKPPGCTRTESIDGMTHSVWRGSHVRDTWIKTSAGWKRRDTRK